MPKFDEKMQRLTRWMITFEQPEPLDLDHQAQRDIAWAADEILTLQDRVDTQKIDIECAVEDISTLVSAIRRIYAVSGEDENVASICNEILDDVRFAGYVA